MFITRFGAGWTISETVNSDGPAVLRAKQAPDLSGFVSTASQRRANLISFRLTARVNQADEKLSQLDPAMRPGAAESLAALAVLAAHLAGDSAR